MTDNILSFGFALSISLSIYKAMRINLVYDVPMVNIAKKLYPSPLDLVLRLSNPSDTIPELNDQSPGTCHYTILQRSGTLPGGGCKPLEIPREVKPGAIPTHHCCSWTDC
jgi:hypothetical protein